MNSLWSEHRLIDALVSGGAFVLILLGVALWELFFPEHKTAHAFAQRWANNFLLLAASVALSTLLAPSLTFVTNAILGRSPL